MEESRKIEDSNVFFSLVRVREAVKVRRRVRSLLE
jgi:hypothetical protein